MWYLIQATKAISKQIGRDITILTPRKIKNKNAAVNYPIQGKSEKSQITG